jgi:transcriptional regulator EpsA
MQPNPFAPEQSEYLLRVMEGAPQVCRRHQFFVWSQGDLQRWLPHTIALCGAYDRETRALSFDLFNSLPMPADIIVGLLDGRSMLIQQALHAWQRGQQQAVRVSVPTPAELLEGSLGARLRDVGYRQMLVHGTTRPGRADELESLFILMRHEAEYDDFAVASFGMLLPCLHLTYQRVAVTERLISPSRDVPAGMDVAIGHLTGRQPAITEREREILRWVRDGMSNQQIGEQLGISGLTVKNHVQKILRKLGAANRAQAVAKAMSMNALGATQAGADAPPLRDATDPRSSV